MDYLAPNSCAAQRPSRPAQPAGGPARLLLCRLRPRQREGSVPGARTRHRATPPACLSACPASAMPRCFFSVPPRSPGLTPLSPVLFPFSLALSLSCPNASVAAVRHSRRHRPPLAFPTRAGAPPPPPEALRQATRCRTPRGVAVAIVFLLGLRPPSPSIRRLQRVPEPASTPTATAVSYATVSPSPSPRSLTVASSPPRPNLRRRRARRRRSSGDHLVTPASPTSS